MATVRGFPRLRSIHSDSWVHPVFSLMGNGAFVAMGEIAWL